MMGISFYVVVCLGCNYVHKMLLGPSGTAFKYIIAIQNIQTGPKKVLDVVITLDYVTDGHWSVSEV